MTTEQMKASDPLRPSWPQPTIARRGFTERRSHFKPIIHQAWLRALNRPWTILTRLTPPQLCEWKGKGERKRPAQHVTGGRGGETDELSAMNRVPSSKGDCIYHSTPPSMDSPSGKNYLPSLASMGPCVRVPELPSDGAAQSRERFTRWVRFSVSLSGVWTPTRLCRGVFGSLVVVLRANTG